jgi:hypothetical protein
MNFGSLNTGHLFDLKSRSAMVSVWYVGDATWYIRVDEGPNFRRKY